MVQAENLLDFIGLLFGFGLTVCVLSYMIGDNPLFRFANNIFIGVTAAFVVLAAIYHVLIPHLLLPLLAYDTPNRTITIISLILSGLIFLKISPNYSRFGNPALAMLVGIGAAVVISGAIRGTIFPQSSSLMNSLALPESDGKASALISTIIEGVFILFGTLSTLLYFQFGVKQSRQAGDRKILISWIISIGKLFIVATLGIIYAAILLTTITAFTERFQFLFNFLVNL